MTEEEQKKQAIVYKIASLIFDVDVFESLTSADLEDVLISVKNLTPTSVLLKRPDIWPGKHE
jgi:hypothetical protein